MEENLNGESEQTNVMTSNGEGKNYEEYWMEDCNYENYLI